MNYDKYPEIKINGFDDQVFADVQGIKNELEKILICLIRIIYFYISRFFHYFIIHIFYYIIN